MTTTEASLGVKVDGPIKAMEQFFKGAHDHLEIVFVKGRLMWRLFVSERNPEPGHRVFDNDSINPAEWKFYVLDISPANADKMFTHADTAFREQRYDSIQARLSVAPPFLRSPKWCRIMFSMLPRSHPLDTGTYCAKMCCETLQIGGFCPLDARFVTSQDIIFSLESNIKKIAAITPAPFP